MSASNSCRDLAERFAEGLKVMLNKTVCDDVYIGVAERPDGSVSFGTGMWPGSPARDVQMRATGSCAVWLRAVGHLYLDPDGYLTVAKSAYIVSAGDVPHELFHYDYERDKADYPDAHMQVVAGSAAWDELLRATGKKHGSLGKLHLPVGGKRYRPALEDILEALVAEEILDPKSGWRRVLEETRLEFRRRQLRAAIRRDPDTAVAALRDRGYVVVEPDRSPNVVPFDVSERLRPRLPGKGRRKK